MKYCLRYANSSKVLIKEADEISIIYNKNDAELPAFIEKHPNQRITLIIQHPEDAFDNFEIKKLRAVAEKYADTQLTICLYQLCKRAAIDNAIIEKVRQVGLPWYTGNTVTSWDALHYFLALGVSDVYITEELCFDLPIVAKLCHEKGVGVRVIPNVAQSSINETPDLKKFFIRPEDLETYAPYIDTIEFWGELTQQDTYYKIYKSGRWYGDLKEIIFSFDTEFDSRRVLPIFGSARLGCGKRCFKGFNYSICDNVHSISKKMEAQNLIIKNRH